MSDMWPAELIPCVEAFLREDWQRPPGKDFYQECFDTSCFFPLQRQQEMAAMMRIARKAGPKCNACDGDGSLMQQWAKEEMIRVGGSTRPLSDGRKGVYYVTAEGKEMAMKTIGGLCGSCHGSGSVGPTTVMEIGSDKGGGVYSWLKCLPSVRRMIACEVRGVPWGTLMQHAFQHVKFLFLRESSLTAPCVAKVGDWLGKELIDVLFIDGDKSYMDKDFDYYLQFMNLDHGVVFTHDVTDEAPGECFRRIRDRKRWKTDIIVNKIDSQEACLRAKQGIPPASPHEGWLRHWEGRSCGVGVIHLGENP